MDVGDEALDLLSIKQVAKRLNVSPVTVRRKIASGELGKVNVGRRVLVAPEDLADYKRRLRAASRGDAA